MWWVASPKLKASSDPTYPRGGSRVRPHFHFLRTIGFVGAGLKPAPTIYRSRQIWPEGEDLVSARLSTYCGQTGGYKTRPYERIATRVELLRNPGCNSIHFTM